MECSVLGLDACAGLRCMGLHGYRVAVGRRTWWPEATHLDDPLDRPGACIKLEEKKQKATCVRAYTTYAVRNFVRFQARKPKTNSAAAGVAAPAQHRPLLRSGNT
jgi:hypothetical protein